MSGSVRLPSRRSAPTALPSRRLVGHEVERVVGDLEGDADVEPVARERLELHRAGTPPSRAPIRQHADMKEAVFCVMIRT